MLIGSMLQVVWRVWLLVYLSAFVMNRKALFRAVCGLYLTWADIELRGAGGYMRAGRMVVLYSLIFLCSLRPENFLSAKRRC